MPPEIQQPKRALEFSTPGASEPGDRQVEITIATNAGACFGVVRAIKLGYQAAARGAAEGRDVFALGALIHNPKVVDELTARGVKTVGTAGDVTGGTAVLRSHGIRREIEGDLRSRGVRIVDATCPLVKKPQRIAQSIGEKGEFLVVVGDAKHPEVQGVLSYFGREDYLVTYHPADVSKIPANVSGVGVLAQTTIEVKVFDAVVEAAKARFLRVSAYNTICDATSIRQTEADTLARQADVVVVVGGKNSSNTTKLVKICKEHQKDTYHVENFDEIDPAWFHGKFRIGVTGGASTPSETVDAAGEHIARLLQPAP